MVTYEQVIVLDRNRPIRCESEFEAGSDDTTPAYFTRRVRADLRQGSPAGSRDSLSCRGLGALLSSRNKRHVQGVTALMIETPAMLFRKHTALTIMAAAAVALSSASANADQPYTHQDLKSPSEFMSISSPAERSRAIFNEIGKLLTHPRCMNCHPAGDHPLQGIEMGHPPC
jgi:hypothetical protein